MELYAKLLPQLWRDIKNKSSGKLRILDLFNQEIAPARKYLVSVADVRDRGLKLIDYPPYSFDLGLSAYHLFCNMKKKLVYEPVSQCLWRNNCCWCFFYQRMKTFISLCSKHCKADDRSVWAVRGAMLKNKQNLATFYGRFLDRLLTCQSTNVNYCPIVSSAIFCISWDFTLFGISIYKPQIQNFETDIIRIESDILIRMWGSIILILLSEISELIETFLQVFKLSLWVWALTIPSLGIQNKSMTVSPTIPPEIPHYTYISDISISEVPLFL